MSAARDLIEKIASFGKQEDGACSRPFGSRAYRQAAVCLRDLLEAEGFQGRIDPVGNVHGYYAGDGSTGKELLLGSHLDTVTDGGKYDGLYGVAAAYEVMSRLQKGNVRLPFAIHLIATNGEEGNILGGTFGSRCLVGKYTEKDWENYQNSGTTEPLSLTETEGHSLDLQDIRDARIDFTKSLAYIELHIEQGITLEQTGKNIGIVTGIVGLRRYHITVHGKRNHSGTTKMKYREDALVKAAKIILYADTLTGNYEEDFVATTQKVQICPNTLAVINGEVEMVLEIRSIHTEFMDDYEEKLKKYLDTLHNVTMETMVSKAPILTDPGIRALMVEQCKQSGIDYLEMPSGATHDGNMMALQTPVAMIFVPSKDGISHEKAEWTAPEDLDRGVDVLYSVVTALGEQRKAE